MSLIWAEISSERIFLDLKYYISCHFSKNESGPDGNASDAKNYVRRWRWNEKFYLFLNAILPRCYYLIILSRGSYFPTHKILLVVLYLSFYHFFVLYLIPTSFNTKKLLLFVFNFVCFHKILLYIYNSNGIKLCCRNSIFLKFEVGQNWPLRKMCLNIHFLFFFRLESPL